MVELMVALTGGLVFSIFVFMLTRDVSRFFRQESGLSDATTAVMAGYQRLRADVQRAGFLASPNFAKDMGRCPARSPTGTLDLANITGGNWATYDLLRDLALARVTTGATVSTWLTANGLSPDELTLYGNYTTADQYPVRSLASNVLFLNPNSEELARAGYDAAGSPTAAATILAQIFQVGRILRVVSANTGEEQYSIISATAASTAASPTVTFLASFPLVTKAAGTSCGIRGLGADLLVNPVNIVRYRLGSLAANTAFAPLYSAAGAEASWPRLDLLREELSPQSSVGALAQELVAEFAVDFRVGVQAVTNTATGATTYYEAGDANVAAFLGQATAAAATAADRGPHMIRALRPRLAVRTRAPDRQGNVATGTGLYRVPLTTGSGGTGPGDFARVRTLQSFIMTRNTRNRVWN